MADTVTYEPSAEDVFAAARAIAQAHLAPEARRPARIMFGELVWEKLKEAHEASGPPGPVEPTHLYGIPAALDKDMQPYGWLVLDENGGTCGAGLVGEDMATFDEIVWAETR